MKTVFDFVGEVSLKQLCYRIWPIVHFFGLCKHVTGFSTYWTVGSFRLVELRNVIWSFGGFHLGFRQFNRLERRDSPVRAAIGLLGASGERDSGVIRTRRVQADAVRVK